MRRNGQTSATITLPLWCTFSVEMEGDHYQVTEAPGSTLVVERMAAAIPAWRTPGNAVQQQPRRLILCDFSLHTWQKEPAFLANIVETLSCLLDQGVEIYLWQEDEYEKMTPANLRRLLNKRKIRPTGISVIREAMSEQLAVPFDQLAVLDYVGLRKLLAHNKLYSGPINFNVASAMRQRWGHSWYFSDVVDALVDSSMLPDGFCCSKSGSPSNDEYRAMAILRHVFPRIPLQEPGSQEMQTSSTESIETQPLSNVEITYTLNAGGGKVTCVKDIVSGKEIENRAELCGQWIESHQGDLQNIETLIIQSNNSQQHTATDDDDSSDDDPSFNVLLLLLQKSPNLCKLSIDVEMALLEKIDLGGLILGIPSLVNLRNLEIVFSHPSGSNDIDDATNTAARRLVQSLILKAPHITFVSLGGDCDDSHSWGDCIEDTFISLGGDCDDSHSWGDCIDDTFIRGNPGVLKNVRTIFMPHLPGEEIFRRAPRLRSIMRSSAGGAFHRCVKDYLQIWKKTFTDKLLKHPSVLCHLSTIPKGVAVDTTYSLVARSKRLEYLDANFPIPDQEWMHNHATSLATIKRIEIDMSGRTLDDLIELLHHMPRVFSIGIKNFQSGDPLTVQPDFTLPFLCSIHFKSGCVISSGVIQLLAYVTPFLAFFNSALQNGECPVLYAAPTAWENNWPGDIPQMAFSQLQRLFVTTTSIHHGSLHYICQNANKLGILKMSGDVTGGYFTEQFCQYHPKALAMLGELTVAISSPDSIECVKHILSHTHESLKDVSLGFLCGVSFSQLQDMFSNLPEGQCLWQRMNFSMAETNDCNTADITTLIRRHASKCRVTFETRHQGISSSVRETTYAGDLGTSHRPGHGISSSVRETTYAGDLDTTYKPGKKLQAKQYFWEANGAPVPVHFYRCNVFTKINVNPNPLAEGKPPYYMMEPQSTAELHLSSQQVPSQLRWPDDRQHCYYGRVVLMINVVPQPLPSLSPDDKLLCMHASLPSGIQLTYSPTTCQYYVHHVGGKTGMVTFEYILHSEPMKTPVPGTPLANNLVIYKQFSAGELSPKDGATGEDVLTQIGLSKHGACRHRAAHALWVMQDTWNVRVVGNAVHQWVEVYDGTWKRCDLGGLPYDINIDKKSQDLPAIFSQPVTTGTASGSLPEGAQQYNSNPFAEHNHLLIPSQGRQPSGWEDYCDSTLYDQMMTSPKTLLQASSKEEAHALMLLCQQRFMTTGMPVFLVDGPEDLICASNRVQKNADDATGQIVPGPTGPLHAFLIENKRMGGVLLINWSNFNPREIVQCNALLDDPAIVDGTTLPSSMRVVGLSTPETYSGVDFHGRFGPHNIVELPKTLQIGADAESIVADKRIPKFIPSNRVVAEHLVVLNCYDSDDWQERLLGSWRLLGQTLVWHDGLLSEQLKRGETQFEIRNGPFNLEDFNLFLERLLLTQELRLPSGEVMPTQGLQMYRSSGYVMAALPTVVSSDESLTSDGVLNPTLFSSYVNPQYTYQAGQQKGEGELLTAPSKLEALEGKLINLFVSRNLSVSQWAELLDTCEKWSITLTLIIPPAIQTELPKSLFGAQRMVANDDNAVSEDEMTMAETATATATTTTTATATASAEPSAIDASHVESPLFWCETHMLVTTDMAYTLYNLQQPSDIVIPVAEVSCGQLFQRLHGEYDTQAKRFRFSLQVGDIKHALVAGRRVILTGVLSEELADAIAGLCLEGQQEEITGCLLLVSDRLQPHLAGVRVVTDQPSQRDISNALAYRFAYLPIFNVWLEAKEGQSQKIDYAAAVLELNHIKRMYDLAVCCDNGDGNQIDLCALWLMHHQRREVGVTVKVPIEERAYAVLRVLRHAPMIFISGPTGIGKSTFVHRELSQHFGTIYIGDDDQTLRNWATDTGPGLKGIFIDESNLTSKQWSAKYEGLFYDPPQILIDQTVYHLTSDHKVVFAGNPASYGNGRTVPNVFEGSTLCVEFMPLPITYVEQKIVLPILTAAGQDLKTAQAISNPLLLVYQYISKLPSRQTLITPRELQMMALLVCAEDKARPDLAHAWFHACSIGSSVLSRQQQLDFKQWFLQMCPKDIQMLIAQRQGEQVQDTLSSYVLTSSRHIIHQQLQGHLQVRQLRVRNPAIGSDGGLGGVVLEGESSQGKSKLVIDTLETQGMAEVSLATIQSSDPEAIPSNAYCHIPAVCNNKEAILLRAFHAGVIVVIDEINSFSIPERLLNDLLMGHHQGTKPTHPGFMVIGTQNPISMEGRQQFSWALQRRLQKLYVPSYTREEAIQILRGKGLILERATRLYQDYKNAQLSAPGSGTKPPSFRDLMSCADAMMVPSATATATATATAGATTAEFENNASFRVTTGQVRHYPVSSFAVPVTAAAAAAVTSSISHTRRMGAE